MPRSSRPWLRHPAACALLALALAGCAALERPPEVPDEPLPDAAERGGIPAAERYPWCRAEPLPEPDADYRAAMTALNDSLGIPEHRLKIRGLRLLPDARELQAIEIDSNRGVIAMSPDAAQAWILMQAAARADGITLMPISTYRSPSHQRWIVYHRLRRGQSVDEVLHTSMAPGYSEHHTGDAIDIATPSMPGLGTAFAETEAFAWLMENAGRYCFELSYPEGNPYGIAFEPWHWRFVRRARE